MAVELAPGLGGVALFTAPGLAVCGLAPGLRRLPLPRRLAYAYLLGVATVGGGLYALSHFAGVPLRRPAILAVAAAPVLAGLAAWGARLWRRDRRGKERRAGRVGRWPWRRPFDPGGLLVAACAVIAAAVCLGVLLDAVTDPVKDWDGRMTWCAQARYVRAAATVDAAVLREGQWFITHPQYPLLLPLAQVAEMEVFGTPDDGHAFRALYAAFLPALLLVAYDGARRWAGRAPAALVTLAASLIPFMMKGEGGANSAYSDLPLACFYGAGLLLLLAGRARSGDGLAAGLLLGAAVLTKNEGLPYAVLALLLGCVVSLAPRPRLRGSGPTRMVHGSPAAGTASGAAEKSGRGVGGRLPLRRLAAAGLPVVLAIALLVAWRAGIPNREDENYPGFVRPADFWPAAFTRLPQVVPVMLSKMYDWEGWTAFWWMAPAVLVAGWRALRRPVARRLLIAAAAPPAMAWAVYSVHWLPTYIASVTWERFLFHGMVPLLVSLAIALADVLRRTGLWSRASS